MDIGLAKLTFPFYKKNGWGFFKVIDVNAFIIVSSYYKQVEISNNSLTYARLVTDEVFVDSTREEFENDYLKTLELFSEVI